MKSKNRKTLALATTLIALQAPLSGCRLGNRVVKAADPTAMSGFYASQPKSMTLCAFVAGNPAQCVAADLSTIPSSIQTVMTDPVYVAANTSTKKAYLLPNSLDTNSAFDMIIDPSGKLTAEPYFDAPSQLWTDPACLSQVQIQKEGMIRESTAAGTDASGNFELAGSVDFSLGVLTVLGSSCAANLTLMKDCYQDAALCPGATLQEQQADQDSVRSFLDPYLSRGALTLEQLPDLMAMGWEAAYE